MRLVNIHPYNIKLIETYCEYVNKDVVSVEVLVKAHVVYLHCEDHGDASLSYVFREHLSQVLNQSKHPNIHKQRIENEGIHECFIGP